MLKYIAEQTKITNLFEEKFAIELDKRDELSSFRQRFYFPIAEHLKREFLYFTGNSLGLQPKTTRKYIEEELKIWELSAVEGHFKHDKGRPWLTTDEYVLEQMSHLVGGEKEEVVIMNSLSLNLHLMMVPFYRPTNERYKIIIEAKAFPSDLYAVQCQIKFHGFNPEDALLQIKPREGEFALRTEDILKFIEDEGDSVALILLAGVQYYTGQFFEMEKITAIGQKKGCKVGWDLAHAVGNVILKLHDWNVDFACWCTYKYLNSGPGNIGGAFIHSKHANNFDLPRFGAWWAHDLKTRFEMDEPIFKPIPGAFGFRCSNPPVLCVAALLASVEIFEEATLSRLRIKSILLTGYLELLIKNEIEPELITIITPTNPQHRGCQLSLLFKCDVTKIHDSLMENGILCDVRKPNVLRVSPTPLYNSFQDVRKFVEILKQVL